MGREQQVTLHIGLPKTASTTLQTHVFPQIPGYVGKFYGEGLGSGPALRYALFKDAVTGWRVHKPGWRAPLRKWIESIGKDGEPPILASDEGLSSWPVSGGRMPWNPWPLSDGWANATRVRPHPVVMFLAAVREAGGEHLNVRVILTLRNQSDFMGSLYAQIQRGMRFSTQDDFEAKVTQSLLNADPFYDYASLVEELEVELGEDDLLVLLHEDGLERNVARIAEFLDLPLVFSDLNDARENVKRHGRRSWQGASEEQPVTKRGPLGTIRKIVDRWWPDALHVLEQPLKRTLARLDKAANRVAKPLTRDGVVITMPDCLTRDVREHCAKSNGRLADRLGRDLQSLGY